ncbi:tripartite tricarboxylate transporter substrate-binding protein [Pseudomonas sp. dw_358]|uniref:tripartite tricarboxylate transporter substrate-binding protein n=1 Tax=Pseudomonas sp. dw_358 TaxID=2720083 RepID=UPI001BD5BEFC|nr:tripartite tricarboxylate transporter substrate-binding protein [Pseudomonas sp. dw_358]
MFDRRRFLRASGALLLGAQLPSVASAATAGNRARLIFGSPAGAAGTELGQACMAILNARTGTDYVFENVDARNSRTAALQIKNGAPDGSQMLLTQSTSLVMAPAIYKSLGYDPLLDLSAVTSLADCTFSLTLGPAVPANITRLDQYVEWVNSNLDQRDVGFANYGSQGHLATLMLARSKSVPLEPRAYQGTLMLYKDLLAGGLAAGITHAGDGNANVWATGRLRSIGVTSAQRTAHWPNVPTLAEQGVTGMDLSSWYAWYVAASTPNSVLTALRDKARVMKNSPEFGTVIKQMNMTALDLDPAALAQRVIAETASYRSLILNYGIRPLD